MGDDKLNTGVYIASKNVCRLLMAEVERWVELFAHRGNANGDSGIPVFRPHAVTVFSPGLQSEEHNTAEFGFGSREAK